MPTPKLTLADAKIAVDAVNAALRAGYRPPGARGNGPGAIHIAAKAIGEPRTSIQTRLDTAKHLYGLVYDSTLYKPREAKPIPPKPSDIDEGASLERQRLLDKVARLEADLRSVRRTANYDEDIRKGVFGLSRMVPSPPQWKLTAPKDAARFHGMPVLFGSDFQFGEVVLPEQVEYKNAFNVEIAKRRYRTMIEKSILLCFDVFSNPSYPGIIYARGGDAVSGDIHSDLRETNELSAIPAVMELANEEIAGIEHLADRFEAVWVISIPGNHGRTTIKPPSKNYAELSYELLLADIIERHFRAKDDKRVQFWTPRSADAVFRIFGWTFVLTHGDRIGSRGGQGFIGPIATIIRGTEKIRRQYATWGTHVHWVMMGHHHTTGNPPHCISNGSLVGYNQFARDIRADPEPAQQTLFLVHPEWGVTSIWPIKVDSPTEPAWRAGEPVEIIKGGVL